MDKDILLNHLIKCMTEEGTMEAEKETAISLYLNQLSSDISAALGRLDTFNAALVVGMLETYADAIRKDFECREGVVEGVRRCRKERIMITLPKKREDSDAE